MKVIGLTGGIASGKSTVSLLFRQKGAVIIDADIVARQILRPGTPAWSEVVEDFGEDILKDHENIDRKKLGKIVFADKEKLKILNEITHPRIVEEIRGQLESYRDKGSASVVVIDAALLLEVGLYTLVDEIWVVTIDEKTQLKRLMARDNLSLEEALARIKAQSPQREKIRYAHRIIDNSGTEQQTRDQFEAAWRDFSSS